MILILIILLFCLKRVIKQLIKKVIFKLNYIIILNKNKKDLDADVKINLIKLQKAIRRFSSRRTRKRVKEKSGLIEFPKVNDQVI